MSCVLVVVCITLAVATGCSDEGEIPPSARQDSMQANIELSSMFPAVPGQLLVADDLFDPADGGSLSGRLYRLPGSTTVDEVSGLFEAALPGWEQTCTERRPERGTVVFTHERSAVAVSVGTYDDGTPYEGYSIVWSATELESVVGASGCSRG